MSFRETFTSQVLAYRIPGVGEMPPIPTGIGLSSLYNEYLVTAPRIYGEEIDFVQAMYFYPDPTPNSGYSIIVEWVATQIYWPGWGMRRVRFDPTTGEFLGYFDGTTSFLNTGKIMQSWDDSLWRFDTFMGFGTGTVSKMDYFTGEVIETISLEETGLTISQFGCVLVDNSADIIIYSPGNLSNLVYVIKKSTMDILRVIKTPCYSITTMCPEDSSHIYVLGSNHMLCLLDYNTGQILSTFRQPSGAGGFTTGVFAFDRQRRRLLFLNLTDPEANGASTLVIRGFYPVPLGTFITAPLPLTAPRKYRTTPVLTRVIGDAGEPIGGQRVNGTATEDGIIVGSVPISDNTGYAVIQVQGIAEGTSLITTTTEVQE